MSIVKTYLKYLYASVTKNYKKKLERLLEKNPKAVFLDAGCWDGTNTLRFAQTIGTKNILGLELVSSAAKKAKEKGVKVILADLNKKIPLKNSSVDVIVSNHVIEHLYDVHIFVEQLHRVLKPNGYLVLGTPNLASWHNIFALLIGRQPYSGPTVKLTQQDFMAKLGKEKTARLMTEVKDKVAGENALGHIVVLTYKTLIKLLKAKGFKIEITVCFGYHPFPPFIAKLLANLDKNHSHYILIKARKL